MAERHLAMQATPPNLPLIGEALLTPLKGRLGEWSLVCCAVGVRGGEIRFVLHIAFMDRATDAANFPLENFWELSYMYCLHKLYFLS